MAWLGRIRSRSEILSIVHSYHLLLLQSKACAGSRVEMHCRISVTDVTDHTSDFAKHKVFISPARFEPADTGHGDLPAVLTASLSFLFGSLDQRLPGTRRAVTEHALHHATHQYHDVLHRAYEHM
ncbi:hypothetical protein L210DRAFT_114003 [Boletus edulis BED1]|uniref:Uncharacterized protein n=1 Tax=Boletus edulis BED1 TaxID=1328754 RepID=A0AAD4GCS1_BOLED|nr:hypothetical protein L210DRAFT_114003 [Boletus edulis BED1]